MEQMWYGGGCVWKKTYPEFTLIPTKGNLPNQGFLQTGDQLTGNITKISCTATPQMGDPWEGMGFLICFQSSGQPSIPVKRFFQGGQRLIKGKPGYKGDLNQDALDHLLNSGGRYLLSAGWSDIKTAFLGA